MQLVVCRRSCCLLAMAVAQQGNRTARERRRQTRPATTVARQPTMKGHVAGNQVAFPSGAQTRGGVPVRAPSSHGPTLYSGRSSPESQGDRLATRPSQTLSAATHIKATMKSHILQLAAHILVLSAVSASAPSPVR